MAGIVHKVKDMLSGDKDTTHTDPTHSSHTTGTGHGTMNPADRNNDGKVDAHDLTGRGTTGHGTTGGLTGHGTANPADRNNDGRVDARDLTGQHSGTTGGLGHSSHTHGTANPADRNNDGRVDARDLTGQHASHGTTGGLGHSSHTHGTANPADRNNDGRVDARDLTGQHSGTTGGLGHSSHTHGTANPLDRNNDGRVDARDLTGRSTGHTTGHGTSGDGLANALATPLAQVPLGGHGTDSSGPHNTRTANILDPHVHTGSGGYSSNTTGGGLTGHGTHGHTANPADRNNDGRVDARDLTGQGHSTTGGYGHTANPADRNNDGRVDARDLTGHSTTGAHAGLDHRQGESGDLPRALTEDVSRAQPHGSTHDNHHSTGKPSLTDKLNPKVDSNGDGKAGFMK